MQIIFEAATLAALTKQIRDFLGDAPPAPAPTVVPAPVYGGPALPTGVPAGSHWIVGPGGLMLVGPDGANVTTPVDAAGVADAWKRAQDGMNALAAG